jgi:hypothetical protein
MMRTWIATATIVLLMALTHSHAATLGLTNLPAKTTFVTNVTITAGTTGNGSFETDTTYNWFAALGASIDAVNSGPTPVSTDGSWSLRTFESETDPSVSGNADHRRRNIGLDFTNGDIFHVTLDYYAPSTLGYNQLVLQPLTNDGTTTLTIGAVGNINPITAFDSWVSVDLYWQLDSDDGFNGLDLRVNWRRNGGDSSSTYEGFIDNVQIHQGVFEPIPPVGTVVSIK